MKDFKIGNPLCNGSIKNKNEKKNLFNEYNSIDVFYSFFSIFVYERREMRGLPSHENKLETKLLAAHFYCALPNIS